jgi:hypothetical protein
MQKKPDGVYNWVARRTSLTPDKNSSVKMRRISLQNALSIPYDYFFLCKSGLWSPPHLDSEFEDVALHIREYTSILLDQSVLADRYKSMQSYIKQMNEFMK